MRILLIVHQFFPEFAGGTERVTLNFARMAQRAGHYVRILACTVEPAKSRAHLESSADSFLLEAVHEGIPVSLIRQSDLPNTADIGFDVDPLIVSSLFEWMAIQRFDVAHVMHSMRMGSAIMAIQKSHIPYVVHLTDFYLPCARVNLVNLQNELCEGPDAGIRCALQCAVPPWTVDTYTERYRRTNSILLGANFRIAPSEYVADRYRAAYPGISIIVIPHGIDLLAMSAANNEKLIKIEDKSLELIFIGSIVPQKGLDILINAFAKLKHLHIRLKIVGGFYGNSEYQREILEMASKDSRIKFFGVLEQQEAYAELKKADLLCLPSRVPESFSLVLHESAAAGVPMLVSDLGAPAHQIALSACGQVIPSSDAKAWAEAIENVANDRMLLARWREKLFLPLRIEEEAFFINTIYLQLPSKTVQD